MIRFVALLVALFCFFAAATIVFGWFGVTSGPDPGGLGMLGLFAVAVALLFEEPWPRYFRR